MTRSATSAMNVPGLAFAVSMARAVARLAQALKHRREIMHLAEFDDRMLKDIGLVRADIEGALAEPLVRNPSLVLVRCVDRRRSRSQRVVSSERNARPIVPIVKPACLYA